MLKDVRSASDKYLEVAARQLAQSSPAVSAHLMLSRGTPDVNKSVFHKGICQRCGTIQVPGKTSEAKIERLNIVGSKKQRQRSDADLAQDNPKLASKRGKWLRMECKACHAFQRTRVDSPSIQSNDINKPASRRPTSSKAAEGDGLPAAQSTNQSSKARAKARRGGLQAMLARPRESANVGGGLGLDLMDLMKEGDS